MAEWRGMKVKLNSPSPISKGEPGYGRKKSKVFVMKNGKVKKIMFGDPNMKIRKNNPKARASFRARHKCSTAKDKTSARYWSCRAWWGERMAKVSWMWGGKRYSGTLIPSRETKTHRFARTENGKIKKLPKNKK